MKMMNYEGFPHSMVPLVQCLNVEFIVEFAQWLDFIVEPFPNPVNT